MIVSMGILMRLDCERGSVSEKSSGVWRRGIYIPTVSDVSTISTVSDASVDIIF